MRAQLEHQPHLEKVDLDQLVQRIKPRLGVGRIGPVHPVKAGNHGRGTHLGVCDQCVGDLGQLGRCLKARVQLGFAPGDQADPLPHQPVDGRQRLAKPRLGSQRVRQRIIRQPLLPQEPRPQRIGLVEKEGRPLGPLRGICHGRKFRRDRNHAAGLFGHTPDFRDRRDRLGHHP